MIEPELKKELDQVNENLEEMKKSYRIRSSFYRGVLSGIGSVIGVALALALIGWILNVMGVIPGLREQAREWKGTLDRIERLR